MRKLNYPHWLPLIITLLATLMATGFSRPSFAISCDHQDIKRCIQGLAIASSAEPSEPAPNPPWLIRSPEFLLYHQALLTVAPKAAAKAKQTIVAIAATLPSLDQQEIFIELALMEFFGGDSNSAAASLEHALALSDQATPIVLLQYFMSKNKAAMERLIRDAGFSLNECNDPEQAKLTSLRILDNLQKTSFHQQIQTLPHIQWQLLSWFLLARYMETLNQCLLLPRFYDYQLYLALKAIESNQQQRQWARWTQRLY